MRLLLNIYSLVGMAAVALGLAACSDELVQPGTGADFEKDVPVTLSVDYSVGNMRPVSRADMAEGRDREVKSVWLAFFDAAGNKKHEFTYGQNDLGSIDQMDVTLRSFNNLEVLSGTYTIAAVGNPTGNKGIDQSTNATGDLMTLLQNVETLDQYRSIAVSATAGAVDVPSGNLVMQGIYVAGGSHGKNELSDYWVGQAEQTVDITPSTTKLGGVIHFRRLISQIKFQIKWDTQKFSSFRPVSATIYNVPSYSWLAERTDGAAGNKVTNAGDVIGGADAYATSQRFYNFTPDKAGTAATMYTLDWYQMENRRVALPGYEPADYAGREQERKDAVAGIAPGKPGSEKNTGVYVPLCGLTGDEYLNNNNATYIEVKALMDIANPGTGVQSRQVEATYTVHLGYCENNHSPSDYNCRRNTKYTYTMTVNDIDKIMVEADVENVDQNHEHGAEGVITDVTDGFFDVDAHYEAYNIQLSEAERTNLKWSMRIYTSQTEFITIDQDNYKDYPEKYYNWIEFIPNGRNTGATYAAPYHPTTNNYKLHELADANVGTNYSGRFTMFVNEYVYEDAADGGRTTPNWKGYVNLPPRMMWLKVEEKRSADGESQYFTSKYAVRQKSLQTYYGTGPENPSEALTLEHVDEIQSGRTQGTKNAFSDATLRARGGRFQTAYNLRIVNASGTVSNQNWSTYVTRTAFINGASGGVQGRYNSGYSAHIYACLNRNRDLNGDGVIQPNELRWFVPNIDQYVRFALGSYSLEDPIFDFADYTLSGAAPSADVAHFGSSEGHTLWAEEYTSTNRANTQWNDGKNVRCARYVGVDMNEFATTPAQPAFEKVDGENKIKFHYGVESSRQVKVLSPLPWHVCNTEYNRPYKGIEYKGVEDDIVINSGTNPFDNTSGTLTKTMWFNNINNNNICNGFNTDGETGWRVPNQVEMAAILAVDPSSLTGGQNSYLTVTREYFVDGRIMGSSTTINLAVNNSDINDRGARVRCVRDIDR